MNVKNSKGVGLMIRNIRLGTLVGMICVLAGVASGQTRVQSSGHDLTPFGRAGFMVWVDPISGEVSARHIGRGLAGGERAAVSQYFDGIGVTCPSCGTFCNPAGDSRLLEVNLEMDDTSNPGAAVTNLALDNVVLGGSAVSQSPSLLDPEPFCDTDPARWDITVNLVGCTPFSIYFDLAGDVGTCAAASAMAYVSNYGSNNVSVIDTGSNTVTATVTVGSLPYGVAVNTAGTLAYVTNYNGANVSVIDTGTNTVTATVNVGSAPRGVAVKTGGAPGWERE